MGSASHSAIRECLLDVLDRRDRTSLATLVSTREDLAAVCVDEIRTTAVLTHRNLIALALSDSHVPGAANAILSALERDEFDDQTGTLLHALNGLGEKLPAETAVRLIERGSYEAHMELADLFECDRISYTKRFGKAETVQALEALIANESDEVARCATEVMEILTVYE